MSLFPSNPCEASRVESSTFLAQALPWELSKMYRYKTKDQHLSRTDHTRYIPVQVSRGHWQALAGCQPKGPQVLRTLPKYTCQNRSTIRGAPPSISSPLSAVLTSCSFPRPSVGALNSGVIKRLSGGALGSQQFHISTESSWFDAGGFGEGV